MRKSSVTSQQAHDKKLNIFARFSVLLSPWAKISLTAPLVPLGELGYQNTRRNLDCNLFLSDQSEVNLFVSEFPPVQQSNNNSTAGKARGSRGSKGVYSTMDVIWDVSGEILMPIH